MDGVDRRLEPANPRGQHEAATRISEFGFVGAPLHSHVAGEIAGAERHPAGAGPGGDDGVERVQPGAGLDDRHQVDAADGQVALAFILRHQPVDEEKFLGAFDLGQDDTVEPGADDMIEIAVAPDGVGGIDPDITEARTRRGQRRDDGGAAGNLVGDGAGVLKIEDDRIGAAGKDMSDLAGMVGRGEQEAADGRRFGPVG